jgi:hypothetical protein
MTQIKIGALNDGFVIVDSPQSDVLKAESNNALLEVSFVD